MAKQGFKLLVLATILDLGGFKFKKIIFEDLNFTLIYNFIEIGHGIIYIQKNGTRDI